MKLEQQIINYALKHEPQECCGFVVFKGQEKIFLPCENIADDPENYFEISTNDWLLAHQYDGIVAVVHSHPEGEAVLSTADRQMQVQSGLDWWLVCDGQIKQFRNVPHLVGRDFEHGIMDCYTLFRDAYMLAGLDLPDFEREDGWWTSGENLYLDNLTKQGFHRTDDGVKVGDVILMQVGANVPNHAAIYLGKWHQVLHHSPNRLSKRDLYDGYWFKHTHSIWRHKDVEDLNFNGIFNDLAVTT